MRYVTAELTDFRPEALQTQAST